jgi:hypothetical protein
MTKTKREHTKIAVGMENITRVTTLSWDEVED